MVGKMKVLSLTVAAIMAIEINVSTRADGPEVVHAQQQVLAYGGHNFDRTPDPSQSTQYAEAAAFIMPSGRRLERRRQLQLRSVQASLIGSAKLSSTNGSCGRGRYRDSTTGKCHGPADVGD
jgi:hypothetical protein